MGSRRARRDGLQVSTAALRLLGGLVSLLLLAGCGSGASATSSRSAVAPAPSAAAVATPAGGPSSPVQVTLGLYSGRADPTWTLTDAEAASLDAALAGLSEVIGTPPVGGLGYHGFAIERPAGTVIAFDAAVAPPGDGERTYLADPDRTIERLLLETARAHVSGNELTEVERAISAP